MKDKVQEIRNEVERLQNELIQEREKGYGRPDVDDACILELQNVLTYIDSLQEEPVSEDFETILAEEWKDYNDRGAATVDALEDNTQELAFAKGFYRGWHYSKEKPVSDELENAAKKQATLHSPLEEKARELAIAYFSDINDQGKRVYDARCEAACQEIANWQKEQMIDKACEWLRKELAGYVYAEYVAEELTGEACISDNMIEDFRKAMEAKK